MTTIILVCCGGIVGYLLGRLRTIPVSLPQWSEALTSNWTGAHTKNVHRFIDAEPDDYDHLIKNIDHLTRPTRIVNIGSSRFRIVIGTNGDRLELEADYHDLNECRQQKIKKCCKKLKVELSEYMALVHDLTRVRQRSHVADVVCKGEVAQQLRTRALKVPSTYQ